MWRNLFDFMNYQSVPLQDGDDGFKVKVNGLNGTIQSPRFREEYVENDYKADRTFHVELDLSVIEKTIRKDTLVIELEIDTRQAEGWKEEVSYNLSSKYRVHSHEKRGWLDAEAQCRSKGGQLATVLSEGEKNEFDKLEIVVNHGSGRKSTLAWIGARKESKSSQWKWPDGTEVTWPIMENALP